MNEQTETLLKTYEPKLAIVAYVSVLNQGNPDSWYLESHEIARDGKLMEGKPLRQDTIQGIVDVFFDERRNTVAVSGLIPENVLQFELLPGGRYSLVWYRPAERRHLYFVADLHIPSGEAWVPAMLYKTDGHGLDVFALPDDKRPTEATQLMNAPFHNVSSHGDVCLGSAKVKKPMTKTYTSLMQYWEDMFWKSEFTHLAGNENPTKTNLVLLWKRLLKDKKLKWDGLDEMVAIKNWTLKKIL